MKIVKSGFIYLAIIAVAILFVSLPLIAFAGNPPDASHSSLTSTEVPADGTTTSSVTVTLKDSGNTPLTGDSVTISAPGDATAVISPGSAVLDGSGQATFTVTSTTPGTDSINVTDTTTSTTLTALGTITFDPVPTATLTPTPTETPTPTPGSDNGSNGNSGSSSTTCGNQSPTDAPSLYQINRIKDSAVLYFLQPSSGFDGYAISYGLTSDSNDYSVSFKEGVLTGAVTYTINDLTPNLTYYFKVRATNGCAAGPWSTVLSANNSGTSILPVTGPGSSILMLGGLGLATLLAGVYLFFIL